MHEALGARFVDFGGWEMPLSYPSGHDRRAPGLPPRRRRLRRQPPRHRARRRAGRAASAAARPHQRPRQDRARAGAVHPPPRRATGSVLDDIIVWWVDDERFDVMPNASNTARVRAAVGGDDVTAERAVLAVQGPAARERLATVVARRRPRSAASASTPFAWRGATCVAAGTGYTGEDGVECAVPAEAAADFLRRAARRRRRTRPASAPATPSASRPACRCTATSSARASRRCRPGSAGSWLGQGRLPGARRCSRERARPGPRRRLAAARRAAVSPATPARRARRRRGRRRR